MNVLHVAPSLARSYGGPTRSLAGFAAASLNQGAEVTVVAPRPSAEDATAFCELVSSELHLFPSIGRHAFAASPRLVQWVSSRAASFDVVHVHGLFNPVSALASAAALRSGTPLVIRPFGTLSRYTYSHRRKWLKWLWLAAIEGHNIDRATLIHFTTSEERDEATWHGRQIGERSAVVPPPWLGAESRARVETNHSGSNRVVFIGRIDPVKNLESLLDAWPLVSREVRDAQLIVAGAGKAEYVRALEMRATRLGIAPAFPGFVDEAAKESLFASAAAFVLPSHHENFGIAALEAIAAGVPAIISPDVQLGSFVANTGTGEVTATTPARLAATIVRVLSDGDLRSRVAREGRRVARATFGIETVGPQLSAMYLDAINRHDRSR